MGLRKIVQTGVELGRGVYEERRARQARLQKEQEERLEVIYQETVRKNDEYAKAQAEKKQVHDETMARLRGRVAIVTNFARGTGKIAPPLIGRNITAELKEKEFGAVDVLVIEALVSRTKQSRLEQFAVSAEALADGAVEVGLAHTAHVGAHIHDKDEWDTLYLGPQVISERIRHHEEQNPGKQIGYIAAVSALELKPFGFPVVHTILGADGEIYRQIVDGGVMAPSQENTDEWQQIIQGNQIALLPEEVREADWRSRSAG